MDDPSTAPSPAPAPERRAAPRRPRAPAVGVVLLVGALWGVTFWGRFDLSPPAPLAVAIIALPFLHGAVALALLLARLLAGPRSLAGPALVAVALVAASLWGPAWLSRPQAGTGEEMVLVSWNVERLGELAVGPGRRQAEAEALDCVTAALREADADVVVLLEVSDRRLALLEERLGLTCTHTDYHGTRRSSAGGLAVCTTLEGDWRLGLARPLDLSRHWQTVFAEVSRGGATWNVLAAHLTPIRVRETDVREGIEDLAHGRTGRLAEVAREVERATRGQGEQARQLLQVVARFQDPTVVAGDFNGTRDGAVHVALRRTLTDTWEQAGRGFGATRILGGWLPLRIDYVYATRPHLAVGEAALLSGRCSDHRGIRVRLAGR